MNDPAVSNERVLLRVLEHRLIHRFIWFSLVCLCLSEVGEVPQLQFMNYFSVILSIKLFIVSVEVQDY